MKQGLTHIQSSNSRENVQPGRAVEGNLWYRRQPGFETDSIVLTRARERPGLGHKGPSQVPDFDPLNVRNALTPAIWSMLIETAALHRQQPSSIYYAER